MNEFIENVKKISLRTIDASKPVQVDYGFVVADDPLKIKIQDDIILDESKLVLTRNVTDYELSVQTTSSSSGTSQEIETAVNWAVAIAKDDSYRYVWGGWGRQDGGYDCGHLVITAYVQAGVPVGAAQSTHNMRSVFLANGFVDVTQMCNLGTGAGMQRGDVLLNDTHHAAMVQLDGGTTVEARGKAYGIVHDQPYRNYPWNIVMRFETQNTTTTTSTTIDKVVVENQLKTGDRVLMLRMQGGQKYVVWDRLKEVKTEE